MGRQYNLDNESKATAWLAEELQAAIERTALRLSREKVDSRADPEVIIAAAMGMLLTKLPRARTVLLSMLADGLQPSAVEPSGTA